MQAHEHLTCLLQPKKDFDMKAQGHLAFFTNSIPVRLK